MPQGVHAVRRAGRILPIPLAAIASLALCTAGADAAIRYASPAGGTGSCIQAAPCNVEFAIESAGNGDEVIVTDGAYAVSSEIDATATNLVIHGISAASKPVITSSAPTALNVTGGNDVIRDLKLVHPVTSGLSAGLFLDGATAERVEMSSAATFACGISGGATIRDSVCHSTAANSGALVVFGLTSTIGFARNVTAIADGLSSSGVIVYSPGGTGTVELDGRNVIAKGLPDIQTIVSGTAIAKATMSYSDYSSSSPPNGPNSIITPAGTANNITAPPTFVNAAAGDYHQLASSPTRNAGATDARTGVLDFEGDLRPQSIIDIGGDEFREPASPPPTDTTAPQTRIDKGPAKKTKSKKATFKFSANESGSTFECQVDSKPVAPCTSPLKLKRLKKGKHKLTVTATDPAGNADATAATYKWKVKKKKRPA